METVFDALKAMGKASSQEVAARLGMTRDEAINELWKLKRRGWADNKGPMWWLTNEKSDENDSVTQAPKVTAQMLIEFIGQEGAKTCEELAGKLGVSTRKVASTLAVVTAAGRLARVNQNGKFRYCMPGDNLPAEPKAASVAETDGKAFPQPACVALPVAWQARAELGRSLAVNSPVTPDGWISCSERTSGKQVIELTMLVKQLVSQLKKSKT